jgi:hypothetical protein
LCFSTLVVGITGGVDIRIMASQLVPTLTFNKFEKLFPEFVFSPR